MTLPGEQSEVIRAAVAVLNEMAIAYAIGGSIASSTYGTPRFTHDADITVEPFPGKEAEFAGHFGPEYYLSLPAIEQSNRNRTTFNLLHLATGFKIDFFVRKGHPFAEAVMNRRRLEALVELGGQELFLVSPEDIVLLKLEWYQLGGGMSDRQWSDILGVLRARHDTLDRGYLERSAISLGVAGLLERAILEAQQ
jgi:hypothetical protein